MSKFREKSMIPFLYRIPMEETHKNERLQKKESDNQQIQVFTKSKLLLVFCFVILTFSTISGQETQYKNHLFFVPQYLFQKGLRLDYETRLSPKNWLQICPIFYAGEESKNDFYEFDQIVGAGLSLYHKYYPTGSDIGSYLSYGGTAGIFEMEYTQKINDINESFKTSFQRVGGEVIVGYDFSMFNSRILGGFYAGVGYKFTFTNNSYIKKKFTDFYTDYAYSGVLMLAGFRLGFTF